MQNKNNNPLPSMPGSEIQGTSDSYKGMILQQLSRVNYLLTLGNAKYSGVEEMFSEKSMAKSSLRGMQVLEAMIKPIQNKNYKEKTTPIKQNIIKYYKQFQNKDLEFFDSITQWMEVIIEHLDKLNMLPEEEKELVFD